MSLWAASHSILRTVSQHPIILALLLLVDGFPWHLFVPKSWNFGSKPQGTVSPHGQLPCTTHSESWGVAPHCRAFLRITTQVASKGILRHLLMGTASGTPDPISWWEPLLWHLFYGWFTLAPGRMTSQWILPMWYLKELLCHAVGHSWTLWSKIWSLALECVCVWGGGTF